MKNKKIIFLVLLVVILISQNSSFASFKEGVKSYFQIEDYVSEEKAKEEFIDEKFLVELDKVCEPHIKAYDIDNQQIQELYKNFKNNKNNMYQNRVLYETANNYASDNLKIFNTQLENLYKAHNGYKYTSKYGKYSYYLKFDEKELENYGTAKIQNIKNLYGEWQKIADDVWKYSYNYELKKRDNYYKNKYNAVYGGDIDTLLLAPYSQPKTGEYYTTQMHLNVLQAVNGGVLVSSGQAYAYGYQPHFKNAYIVTNKSYVTGQNITGRFQYIGTYTYTTTIGAKNTVWKFKELTPPSETFYFVSK